MIAVLINVTTVLMGSFLGLLLGKNTNEKVKSQVMISAGLVSLLIGFQMAWKGQRILYILLSLMAGGLIGLALNIEGNLLRLGEALKRLLPRSSESSGKFAEGFLAASVLFCVGAMSILGSFQAGAEGNYSLILIKSALDGFMAFVLAGALGLGVCFSALTILVYQGVLTLLAGWVKPWVDGTPLFVSEVSGVGGIMVMMIGINLLELKKIPAGNFLPALVLVVFFVMADPFLSAFAQAVLAWFH